MGKGKYYRLTEERLTRIVQGQPFTYLDLIDDKDYHWVISPLRTMAFEGKIKKIGKKRMSHKRFINEYKVI